MAYSSIVLSHWQQFRNIINEGQTAHVIINGESLSPASIVAVARLDTSVTLSQHCRSLIKESAEKLEACLHAGGTVYAVNTGIGGSADVRTDAVEDLQQAIVKTLSCGILQHDTNDENLDSLPIAWTKAAQLVRTNTLARGNSGVRLELVESLVSLLQANIVPRTPLRGSISASGDLIPLTYLAGAIQGNPGIQVWVKDSKSRRLTTANLALEANGITPLTYAPKEALALANGTSVSAGAAALALHDAHGCMTLAQILTAMAVESLNGTDESFDQYFSTIRPHPGQKDVAANIRHFLQGSKLTRKEDTANVGGLRQDRYSLRTAPQWFGPEMENMILAHEQVVTECNSITDNPIVREDGRIIQGGNFQASAVTSAMDKIRAALHTVGRMIFQQSAELMMPSMNNGLPPNLTADEPSCDFLLKGTDIASASYQSELAYLSHSVIPFVMVAEQANQSLNSLALVSARYTHQALNIFMQLCANSLLVTCQALDLRVFQHVFEAAFKPVFQSSLPLQEIDCRGDDCIQVRLWTRFLTEMRQRTTTDLEDRVKASMAAVFAAALSSLFEATKSSPSTEIIASLTKWSASMTTQAISLNRSTLEAHTTQQTVSMLGNASKRMYSFVRRDLKVPFLRNGNPGPYGIPTFKETELGTTVGSLITKIYDSLRNGELLVPVMKCLEEVAAVNQDGPSVNKHISSERAENGIKVNGNHDALETERKRNETDPEPEDVPVPRKKSRISK